MSHTLDKVMTDERIIAYLLKELPEEESEQFEDECFAQESWPAQLSLIEEDLIDAYLRGELIQEQRQRFERNYLTTEARQERVIMAAALLRRVDECQTAAQVTVAAQPAEQTWNGRLRAFWSSQNWALRSAAALTVIAIIAGAWWWLSRPHTPSTGRFATLTLTISSGNRAEGAQAGKVKLLPTDSALRISLMLPERLPPAARYRVELENDNGETKSLEIAGRDAQSVSVVIIAKELPRGQYALKLFAINTDGTEQRISGSYLFTVE
jgi:methionine-rich copper-binding protein CopC